MRRGAVVAALATLGLVGCGGGSGDEQTTAATAPPSREAGVRYPAEAREAFMDSCVRGGPSPAQCQCILASLERKLPFTEFGEVTDEAESARREATEECV